jgi:hypothetical protein
MSTLHSKKYRPSLTKSKTGQEYIHIIKRRKAKCIGHTSRRNCLLKHVIEGKIEGRIKVAGRRGIRRRHLLDDLKEKKGYSKFK